MVGIDKKNVDFIEQIKGKLIVSCQAFEDETFHGDRYMAMMAEAAVRGGAAAIRGCWPRDIRAIRNAVEVPIVGINKVMPKGCNLFDDVIITPTLEAAKAIYEAGADIIAMDGTFRKREREDVKKLIGEIKALGVLVMADISSLDEGLYASEWGADIISTTLSGYTRYSPNIDTPDFELIEALVSKQGKPVNAEGRFWTADEIIKAFKLGAHTVTVGTAVTRPEQITRHFVDKVSEAELFSK